MSEVNEKKFFQNEKKFVVGKCYETVRVETPRYGTYVSNIETCDEIGTIIPGSEKILGYYVSSKHYGYGDNGGRIDTFKNFNGETIVHYLDYDGKTRYRKCESFMEERINYLKLVESVGDQVNEKNDHVERYILNDLIVKDISTFLGPNTNN